MQKLDLLKLNGTIVRILDIQQDRVLVIDCCKRTMPQWYSTATFETFDTCTTNELESLTDMELCDIELLDPASRKFIYEHYTMIAGVLPFISDGKLRSHAISRISEDRNISKANTSAPTGYEHLEYWQFRINKSRGRVIGFKIDNMFYVVWFDPHHNLTDSEGYGTATKYRAPESEYESIQREIEDLRGQVTYLKGELEAAEELLDKKA